MRALKEIAGTKAADDFEPPDLEAVQNRCIGRGNSRRYINKLIGRIGRAFKWAASKRLISGSTYRDMETLSGLREGRTEAKECPPVMPVDDTVVDATLPHLRESASLPSHS